MALVLYHYVHCPYCIRVRMALGYLKLPYESRVLQYDDQETPVSLVGVKMLPILSLDGKPMNESLDIIRELDKSDLLNARGDLSPAENFIKTVNNAVHSLAMPYWIFTPEFSRSAKEYFLRQKEAKRGPFPELVKKAESFKAELDIHFLALEKSLRPFLDSEKLTVKDIMVAAHLWGLYIVPEFQFPDKVHEYLQRIKTETRFDYHQDFWRQP